MNANRSVYLLPILIWVAAVAVIGSPAGTRAADADGEAQNAAYWMDNGALLSAYGNYDAAIKSYRKALELDPASADAHFQLGVCYGELRMFEQAVTFMTHAIDLRPGFGAYYYGRGRIHLLAGEREQAMNDFMEAGVLGHPDARVFLETQSGVTWE